MDGTGAAEQRLADALRARAVSGGYGHVPAPAQDAVPLPAQVRSEMAAPARMGRQVAAALLVALLAGLVLGVGMALVSLLLPGLLPVVG